LYLGYRYRVCIAQERDPTTADWMAARAAAGITGLPGRPDAKKQTFGWPYTHVNEW